MLAWGTREGTPSPSQALRWWRVWPCESDRSRFKSLPQHSLTACPGWAPPSLYAYEMGVVIFSSLL